MIRWFVFGIPTLLVVLILAALLNTLSLTNKRKNEMSIGSLAEPTSLNPIQAADATASEITGLIFNGLLKYNQDLEIKTDLAKSWRLSQISSLYFNSPSDAQLALQTLQAHQNQFQQWKLNNASIDRSDPSLLILEFTEPGIDTTQHIANLFSPTSLRPLTQIRIEVPSDAKAAAEALETIDPQISIVRTWFESTNQFEITIVGAPAVAIAQIKQALEKHHPAEKISIEILETITFLAEPVVDFVLRDDVHWHDGVPFTAQDVLFTYEALMDPAVASPRKADFTYILKIEATDNHHVRVVYRKPYSPALLSWMISILPSHLLKNQPFSWWSENFNRRPVGTGPFKFAKWKTNEFVRLVRNPNFFEGDGPWLDAIVFRVLPDPLTLRMAFETKLIDFWTVDPWAIKSFQDDPRFDLFSTPASSYYFVGWNLRNPLFKDTVVREALAHAINIPQMIHYLLYGKGVQSTGIFSPQMWFFNPNVKPIPYDPKRASELLASAGLKRGPDGILNKDGRRFAFTLITNNGNEVRRDVSTLIQANLRPLGIDVKIEIYEWAVFIKRFINQGEFDACVLGWTLPPNYDQFQLWHSSQTNPGQLNFLGYRNPKVDYLLEQLQQEFNRDRIIKLAGELQQTIYNDQPYLFLFVPESTSVMWADAFRIRRPDGQGGWIDSPVEMTKAGWSYYLEWFYRPEGAEGERRRKGEEGMRGLY